MSLKPCPKCKGKVAQNAGTCVHCGHDFGMELAGSCVGVGCIVIAVCVVLILVVYAVDAII